MRRDVDPRIGSPIEMKLLSQPHFNGQRYSKCVWLHYIFMLHFDLRVLLTLRHLSWRK